MQLIWGVLSSLSLRQHLFTTFLASWATRKGNGYKSPTAPHPLLPSHMVIFLLFFWYVLIVSIKIIIYIYCIFLYSYCRVYKYVSVYSCLKCVTGNPKQKLFRKFQCIISLFKRSSNNSMFVYAYAKIEKKYRKTYAKNTYFMSISY